MPGGARELADTAHQFGHLLSIYSVLMIVVAAIVYGLILFAVVRYRRREGAPSRKSEAKLVEGVYAGVLAVVAVVLVVLTYRTENRIDPVSANAGLRVKVTSFQWQWRFDYPKSGRSAIGTDEQIPELVLPVDTRVEIDLVSRDVIHSFWIADARFKRDAFPGRRTRFDLRFDEVGTHLGRCAEFCGLRHGDMNFRVRVLTKDQFASWEQQG